MITVAVRGHDVPGVDDFESLGAGLEGYGVHAVQLSLARQFPDLASVDRINPGMGQTCRRQLGAHGVDVAVLGCYINMIHPDPVRREALLRQFEAHLRFARCFGAPMVASETGSVLPEPTSRTEANFTEEAYRQARTSISRLVAYGERMGTMVGIEPGINHPICSVARTRRLLDEIDSPYLGVVFDPTSLIFAGNAGEQMDLARAGFDAFADRILAVHVRDYRIVPGEEQVQPCDNGEGIMDVPAVLDLVKAYRPMLAVVFEETKGPAIARVVERYANY
ncbi:sugar phosphate isomerase/epimerase family protein [Bifidobacterium asteroides]|uniref:sugar phosphate isomerase/epimerase family protein n=1 Tax=Bifidobacterium asteroides TaxID=1684 RepID=UPI003A803ABD